MKKITSSLILTFLTTCLMGQSIIEGKFQDSKNAPLQFVDIEILTKDSVFVQNAITNNNGYFNISIPEKGEYIFLAEQFGNIIFSKNLELTNNINLGLINITSNEIDLKEVVINSKKPLIEQKIDRMVFNVSNSISASNGDGLSAIKATPGIIVSNEGIKVIGKGSIGVLINDRYQKMSGDDLLNYLKSIPASNIKSIEVITSPPAKYDAEGDSGLINIVLKESIQNQWNNTIRSSYTQGKYASYSIGNIFTYNKNKLNFQFGFDTEQGYVGKKDNTDIQYSDVRWKDELVTKKQEKSYNIDLKSTYTLSKSSNIGAQYKFGYANPNSPDKTNSIITDYNQAIISTIHTNGTEYKNNRFHSMGLFLDTKLDTIGRKISINLDYYTNDNDKNRPFSTNQFNGNTSDITNSLNALTNSNQKINIYTANIDFDHPLSWGNLSYGAKFSYVNNKSYSDYYDIDNQLHDLSKSDSFDYKENINALYVSFRKPWSEKWTSQIGLRLENTNTKGSSESISNINKKEYTKLFPTFYTMYKPNKKNSLILSYSKRISRPAYWELNPFRWYIDSYSYVEGNPFLQPSFTNNIDFKYNYKNKLITTISYSHKNDGSAQIQLLDDQTKNRIYTRDNFYKQQTLTISETFVLSNKFWTSYNTLTGLYSNSEYKYFLPTVYEIQNGWSLIFNSNNSFKISKSFNGELNFSYQSAMKYLMYYIKPQFNVGAGFSYNLLNDNLQITANIFDIFKKSASDIYLQTGEIKSKVRTYQDNQNIRIGLRYNFGNKKIKTIQTKTGNKEELERL
ncbi:TonB-dependent receptor domain-containing protein [Faecalibacter rhinopitheci]|uniref:TonB-dependent receptor n=1 Tax=Faecalibacter rhinopitheci TaxID=2779678 RepID=A0A8J7G7K8_9FLAO|nr:TonB-dependent receptor [Faecalibacter rhinopitheci]MBF0598292.1 TonB-dependent receptor [Faecalibacter rhinopitheci]